MPMRAAFFRKHGPPSVMEVGELPQPRPGAGEVVVTYGATAGPRADMDLRHVFWKQLSIIGSTMGDANDFRRAMSMIFSRQVEPVIQEVLPLEEIRRAHELLESGGVFGKLVLVPNSGT